MDAFDSPDGQKGLGNTVHCITYGHTVKHYWYYMFYTVRLLQINGRPKADRDR